MATINLNVNGKNQAVDVDLKTPVLWVLRDHLNLIGTKFGCGLNRNNPVIENVIAACGIVINPDAAKNMAEVGIIDGIGNALFGELTFKDGIRKRITSINTRCKKESPRKIEVQFVKNEEEPTGHGEPLFSPVFAAVANALYKATGKRFYNQPFAKRIETSPSKM